MKLRKGMMAFIAVTMFFCLLLFTLPISLSVISLLTRNEAVYAPLGILVMGSLSFALCGYLLFWSGSKLLTRHPGIYFDQDGFIDTSHFTSVGFVPWSEVTSIEAKTNGKFKTISIFVTEPNKYLASGNFFAKSLVRSSAKQTGTPINIMIHLLKPNQSELKNLFDSWFAEYKKR